jgi:hypothetical protein
MAQRLSTTGHYRRCFTCRSFGSVIQLYKYKQIAVHRRPPFTCVPHPAPLLKMFPIVQKERSNRHYITNRFLSSREKILKSHHQPSIVDIAW